jgi:hypothetical protein
MSGKSIFLIFDLDGGIGQINSTLPYNFSFKQLTRELNNVSILLDLLDQYCIRATFAITGFSGEEGMYPYVFPNLIKEIAIRNHEIASHSWRHEWIPLFTKEQVRKSLIRSKAVLEKITGKEIHGFVPPHNRPMTWLRHGAYSLGDRGLYPFFEMGDLDPLLKLLGEVGYSWVRVSCYPLLSKPALAGKVIRSKGITVLENHYVGFDNRITSEVINKKLPSYTISAHPLMFDFKGKAEHKDNLVRMLETLLNTPKPPVFITPASIIEN